MMVRPAVAEALPFLIMEMSHTTPHPLMMVLVASLAESRYIPRFVCLYVWFSYSCPLWALLVKKKVYFINLRGLLWGMN